MLIELENWDLVQTENLSRLEWNESQRRGRLFCEHVAYARDGAVLPRLVDADEATAEVNHRHHLSVTGGSPTSPTSPTEG